MEFTVGNAFSEGWRIMKENYGVFLGASVVYTLISIAINLVPILGAIAALIISGPLSAGWVFMGVKANRGRVEFADLFGGFQKFGSTLGIYWLIVLIILGCSIPVAVAAGIGVLVDNNLEGPGVVLIVLGGLVTFALVVILGVRFSLSLMACLDTELGVVDSMRRSWDLTRPHVARLIGLTFSMMLITLVLTLLLYLPVIFLGMPLGMGVAGATYCLITGTGPEAQPAES